MDTELIGDVATPIVALAARDALIPRLLSQTGNQFLAQLTHRLGVDAAVDSCGGHAMGMTFGMRTGHGHRDRLG